MKKLLVSILVVFVGYCFVVNENFRNSTIEEVNNVKEKIEKSIGSGNSPKKKDEFDFEDSSYGYSEESKRYFKEICYGSEFGDKTKTLYKWKKDMKIYVSGEKRDYLISELNNIVYELNTIINPIDIEIVTNKYEANYVIYFCSASEYGNAEPGVRHLLDKNWGLFTVSGSNGELQNGTMYVDIYRCQSTSAQKHVLREELTQSLGMANDSYKYKNSIFYQGWTETNSYAPIDIDVIEILYN